MNVSTRDDSEYMIENRDNRNNRDRVRVRSERNLTTKYHTEKVLRFSFFMLQKTYDVTIPAPFKKVKIIFMKSLQGKNYSGIMLTHVNIIEETK